MARRALITGITGHDGSYLAELLLGKGYELHGVVRRSTETFEHLPSGITLHQGDLLDERSLAGGCAPPSPTRSTTPAPCRPWRCRGASRR